MNWTLTSQFKPWDLQYINIHQYIHHSDPTTPVLISIYNNLNHSSKTNYETFCVASNFFFFFWLVMLTKIKINSYKLQSVSSFPPFNQQHVIAAGLHNKVRATAARNRGENSSHFQPLAQIYYVTLDACWNNEITFHNYADDILIYLSSYVNAQTKPFKLLADITQANSHWPLLKLLH